MTRIVLADVEKSYVRADDDRLLVLQGFSLEVAADALVTLVGPNGSGKSTILNLITGTVPPDRGEVRLDFDGNTPPRAGYVWQDYRASLLPWLSAGENITFPLRIQGVSRRERSATAQRLLSDFAADFDARRPVHDLSGGQQQLVSVLRSLAARPDYLLFDEPLAALDPPLRWKAAFRIERAWRERPVPTVLVTHDIDEAVMLADRVVVLGPRKSGIRGTVTNHLPRPRCLEMLTSAEHIRCREAVISLFLVMAGAGSEVPTEAANPP